MNQTDSHQNPTFSTCAIVALYNPSLTFQLFAHHLIAD